LIKHGILKPFRRKTLDGTVKIPVIIEYSNH
jgi:hypothetical protein